MEQHLDDLKSTFFEYRPRAGPGELQLPELGLRATLQQCQSGEHRAQKLSTYLERINQADYKRHTVAQ